MTDALLQFRDAIRNTGLAPPDAIEPGKLHRFPGVGKGPSNRAGWCLLFDDGLGGCFGDWSSGLSQNWLSRQGWTGSPQAQAKFFRQIKAAKLQADLARRDQHAAAAKQACNIWDAASAAPRHHAYLITKGIEPHNARLHEGCLVLPVTSFECSISSLLFIAPNGRKRLLTGGRKGDCFIAVAGDEERARRIIICEGWATGCTLAENDPEALVLAAIDAGNLKSVAMAARLRWPSIEIIIAGDDDRLTAGNPGATKAQAAAIASGALLALPQWPENAPDHLTDFNDLAVWLAGGGVCPPIC